MAQEGQAASVNPTSSVLPTEGDVIRSTTGKRPREEGDALSSGGAEVADVLFRLVLPSRQIGKVIGKEGYRIQKIREDTKATIKIADAISVKDEFGENGDDSDNDESTEEEEEEYGNGGESTEEEEKEGYGDDDDEEKDGDGGKPMDDIKNAEIEELEKEYTDLRNQEQDLLKNLKHHKDEDLLKGQAVKNEKALWDKTLEFRFLLQKPFSSSNRLPQEPTRSSFCDTDNKVDEAYSDVIASSKMTLDSIMELQEAILEKNPCIIQSADVNSQRNAKHQDASENYNVDGDEEWLRIYQMHSRMVPFRNKSIDKWQRKTQLTTGAAAIKGKLHAFNQNISEQVASYMRDPNKMIKGMQQRKSAVGIFGSIPDSSSNSTEEAANAVGDPELLDDSEFYQQLLKEFFETFDPTSSERAYYALKRLQTKKRKIVDRRASKSRKIRYHVHDKIINFMAPRPIDLPPMAPKLFENLFGLKA